MQTRFWKLPINTPPQHETPSNQLDNSAPESWLEDHGDILFKFAVVRVKDPHVAEDLVQEVLVKAFAAYENFRHEASVRSWLFKILRNEISRFYRKKHKENTTIESQVSEQPIQLHDLLHPQLSNAQFSSAIERDEFWDMIQICFEKIPEHLLETFLYRLANPDEKIETLCQDLDLNPSNFSVRLFRTRLLLRECVERSWLNK